MCQVVGDRFGSALDPATGQLLFEVARLAPPALRLLARLLSRKGSVFREDQLQYAEVPNVSEAIRTLQAAGLVARQAALPADRILALVRVAELQQWFPFRFVSRKRWRKPERIAALLGSASDSQLRARLQQHLQWLSIRCLPQLARVQLLYFGDYYQDLSAFVTEDLGLIRYPEYTESLPDWWDGSPKALLRHETLHRLAQCTHRLDPSLDQSAYAQDLARQLQVTAASREQAQVRDRALLRLGQYFERRELPALALETYQPVMRHPARERRVRLLTKLGEQQAAAVLREDIARAPLCAAEADFAERFGKRLRPTHTLTEVSLTQPTPPRIEAFAAQLLLPDGGSAWHVENRLPLGVAGLLYWDLVYAPLPGAFTRPFQLAPNDLRWEDFTAVRSAALTSIESRWGGARCSDPQALVDQLSRTLRDHQGTANPLVQWHLFDEAFIKQLVGSLAPAVLARLAHFVIRQLGRYHNGFPDLLLIYPDRSYEFVEVKGPGDQLQGAQRRWLTQLETLRIPVRVLKLRPAPP